MNKDLQKDISQKKTELEEKCGELINLMSKHKTVSNSLKSLFDRFKSLKQKKADIQKFIKETKDNRTKVQKEVKEKSHSLKPIQEETKKIGRPKDSRFLEKQIDQIEWKISTEIMPYGKEEALVKQRKEIEEELGSVKRSRKIFKKEQILRGKLKDSLQEHKLLHESVLRHAKDWEDIDKELKKISGEITLNKKKQKELGDNIDGLKEDTSGLRKDLKEFVYDSKQTKKDSNKKKLDKKIEEVKAKFKKEGKLTTEDLMILGAAGEDIGSIL